MKEKKKEMSEAERKKLDKARKKQIDTANKFKDEVLKKYKNVVKAVVLFGSLTRGDFHAKSDIDLLVVIDDTLARFTPEMKEEFDERIYRIGKELSDNIIVQPGNIN